LPLPRPRPPRKPLAEMLALFGSRHVYVGIALQAGLAGSFYAFGNLIGPRWMAAQGVTSLEIGWVTSALILGYGFGAAFWGWFGDKEHQRTRALLFACCAAISCWILLPVFPFRSPFSSIRSFPSGTHPLKSVASSPASPAASLWAPPFCRQRRGACLRRMPLGCSLPLPAPPSAARCCCFVNGTHEHWRTSWIGPSMARRTSGERLYEAHRGTRQATRRHTPLEEKQKWSRQRRF
jgi:hypothetical protein